MRKIIISTESTSDLPKNLIDKFNIEIVPLHITLDGKSYIDGVDISPDLIFEKFEEKRVLPITSAPNVADFLKVFNKYPAKDYEIIHLSLGSGISSSFQNAVLAASNLENVHVIDSGNLSSGFGFLVLESVDLASQGKSVDEIIEKLETIKHKVSTSFVIDNLAFLKEGGRCSSLAAIGANLLSIRPSIEVSSHDASMKVGKKYRGQMDNVLLKYSRERLSNLESINPKRIFITHSKLKGLDISSVIEYVKGLNYFDEIIVNLAGCSITSHCGANTLGLIFLEND